MQDIVAEFENTLVRDKRLRNRLKAVAGVIQRDPSASFPTMFEDESQCEAVYRAMNNENVTFDEVHACHRARSVERAEQAAEVVVVHDTTDIETAYANPSDVGYLQTGKSGYRAHISLAVCVEPNRAVRPFGVVSMQPTFRTQRPKRAGKKKKGSGAQTARWKNKESERWTRGIQASAEALENCSSVVHVMDREADSYPLFSQIEQLGQGFVVRLRNDRRAKLDVDDEDEWSSLSELANDMQGMFVKDVPLSRRGAKGPPRQLKTHPPRDARSATLHFSAVQVELAKPRYLPKIMHLPDSLSPSFVRVWEPDPPEGQEPVEWLLLTNLPCETPAEIARVVDLYRSRWTIEDFNKALKTGCALEERQFESRHALLNVLALFLPIAVHLLWIRTCARDAPDTPATEVFTPLQLTVLRQRSHRKMPDNPTAMQALWALAGIGGHFTSNGPPGWQVLGRAFTKLLEATHAWQLALRSTQQNGAEM